jgi:hypothetical protein
VETSVFRLVCCDLGTTPRRGRPLFFKLDLVRWVADFSGFVYFTNQLVNYESIDT